MILIAWIPQEGVGAGSIAGGEIGRLVEGRRVEPLLGRRLRGARIDARNDIRAEAGNDAAGVVELRVERQWLARGKAAIDRCINNAIMVRETNSCAKTEG